MKVLNHDIYSLVRRLRRFKKELEKSVSSGVSELSAFDRERLVSYINAAKTFKAWSVSQPEMDFPETSPMELDLGESETILDVENDDIALILNHIDIIEKELVNSQSAKRSAGMVTHDSTRFDSYIQKLEDYLTNFVGVISPLDLPESSPMMKSTGAGRTGI